jgi:subtilisin-like proprotein convertase family protein
MVKQWWLPNVRCRAAETRLRNWNAAAADGGKTTTNAHRFGSTGGCKGGSIVKNSLILALVIVLTATLGVAAAKPHASSKKSATEHHTFSNPNALLIPDDTVADPYPSTIKVSGFKNAKLTDVDLRLRGLNHGYADDIDVMLVAPNGDAAIVMRDVGGDTNALSLTLTLDDEAGSPLPDDAPLTSGTYQPANFELGDPFPGAPSASDAVAFSTFNGGDPNGTWSLYVVDDAGNDVGAFSGGWDLKITAKGGQAKHHSHHKHNKR